MKTVITVKFTLCVFTTRKKGKRKIINAIFKRENVSGRKFTDMYVSRAEDSYSDEKLKKKRFGRSPGRGGSQTTWEVLGNFLY